MQPTTERAGASFRDPSGFIFSMNGEFYRQINQVYKEHYELFLSGGLYANLIAKKMLIPHEEVNENIQRSDEWYKTIKPQQLSYISYPYEWCFGMLKEAALLCLDLMNESLPFGLILKDASPFNIQWQKGKPVFIDTLSFEKYDPAKPWVAYRQFCESFLGPLLLMHYSRQPLQGMMLAYPDGIPIAVISKILPFRSRFSLPVYLHIHLHNRLSSKKQGENIKQAAEFSQKKLKNILDSLGSLIRSLRWKNERSTWSEYYDEAGGRENYLEEKTKLVDQMLGSLTGIKTAIDLGANNGKFSLMLAIRGIETIAVDSDHNAINELYESSVKKIEKNILPLIIDLSNPTPAIGLNNEERNSFLQRTSLDLGLALALVHHLAIGKNIPFDKIALLFSRLSRKLIIEFIPKEDPKLRLMLENKTILSQGYTEENFVLAFSKYFSIDKKQEVGKSGRIIYLMTRHV
jgi:hypothetical protein